jgi:hypothetical protein
MADAVLIDTYLPNFDVRDYHETRVAADAEVAFAAFRALDLERSPIVRLLFTIRNLPSRILGHEPARGRTSSSRSFLTAALDMGWMILEETPGQELVVGAVTQPWAATVIFRGLPPAQFTAFAEPGFTKIVWNIATRTCASGAIVSTETRVLATDPASKRRFRRYWFAVNPGVRLIRRVALAQVRREVRQIHARRAA